MKQVGRRVLLGLVTLCAGMALPGCHSSHLDVTVENRTGSPIRLLEVDYPNASFGSDGMQAGGVMHYRIQVTANGPLSLQYTAADGKVVKNNGPSLVEHAEGNLSVWLLPAGKAEFHPGNGK